jgi:hypothetical protein
LFVCGVLVCGGTTNAQSLDRILTFDSRIAIDKDRTTHFQERFVVVNDSGIFDGGLHRRLRIKPAAPERVKVGSFQSFGVKVDGNDASFHISPDGDEADVEIAALGGTLSRGSHVIELSYTAKHQFEVYDNFEDFNQSITGVWPVSVEKSTVEVSFPEGVPSESGFSADTGTRSDSKEDCVRTDLPNGVRFETTHALPPGHRLAFDSRYLRTGYFISNFGEDGDRAILQNHPFLVPSLVSLCGMIVFGTAGLIVWRRTPLKLASASTVPTPGNRPRSFWREVIKIYRFPMVMFVLAIVPGLNFTYSGHGGPSWLIAPLCFPWVIARMLFKIATESEESSRWYKSFFKATIPSYIAISLPLSWIAVTSIRAGFGLEVSTWAFFALMVSPGPWWYFT